MTDSYAQGVREIEVLRARLREMEAEALAAATPPRGDLEDAVGAAMNPAQPPKDPRRKALENAAHGFVTDPQAEAGIAARARDPKGYDAEMRRVGASNGLAEALYTRQRDAAIKIGAFVPEEGTSNE